MSTDYTTFTETFAYAHAHHLPTFPDGHKCRSMHGHLSEVTITIDVDHAGRRYAFDHAEIDKMAARVLVKLCHHTINEVPGLEDGLAETQLGWLVERFALEVGMFAGAVLREVHLDEWSTGSTYRLVKHRKSWRNTSSIAMLRDIHEAGR
jgi:6-pyruvoyltetrahydropterin/6-carboxytetrahydropterin synthase